MYITILTQGSRGDVQPCIALGVGLQQAEHQAKIATHQLFEKFVGDGSPGSGVELKAESQTFRQKMVLLDTVPPEIQESRFNQLKR